jgi:hypothetical protein
MSGECSVCGEHPVDGYCQCDRTNNPYNLQLNRICSDIIFHSEPGIWAMKITRDGILFNREAYPISQPEDFAQAVIDILENVFTVKFERKNPPYDRKD